jgi:hypothetical protein
MVDEIVIRFENAIGEPVVANELPDVFRRVEFRAFRRQRGLVERREGIGCWVRGDWPVLTLIGRF